MLKLAPSRTRAKALSLVTNRWDELLTFKIWERYNAACLVFGTAHWRQPQAWHYYRISRDASCSRSSRKFRHACIRGFWKRRTRHCWEPGFKNTNSILYISSMATPSLTISKPNIQTYNLRLERHCLFRDTLITQSRTVLSIGSILNSAVLIPCSSRCMSHTLLNGILV